jgi:hypothetical protein
MSASYRVKEHRNRFTPQRRVLGLWLRMAAPQGSIDAANQIIRQHLRVKHPPPTNLRNAQQ